MPKSKVKVKKWWRYFFNLTNTLFLIKLLHECEEHLGKIAKGINENETDADRSGYFY